VKMCLSTGEMRDRRHSNIIGILGNKWCCSAGKIKIILNSSSIQVNRVISNVELNIRKQSKSRFGLKNCWKG